MNPKTLKILNKSKNTSHFGSLFHDIMSKSKEISNRNCCG